ncbi:spore gernimation protein GerM [Salibacterium salarium]|uniref:Spore gernimation protein GerM n=1 Tax=Salibacterium salarium TaxID=284579 RepID=A0A428MU35_9BACI|nr:GerMN domain-containing protein [Salibacterium salarium]RSL29641.1 spore gernimation protein GerM [Salibacterium salarium]
MKRTLYLFITVLLSLGVLAACGQGDEVEENDTGSETEQTADSEETEGEAASDEDSNEGETSSNSESTTDVEQEDTVETDAADEVTETVSLFFSNNDLLETYKEEQEITADSEEELPAAALEAWIAGPNNEELTSHFEGDIDVESVEEEDGVAQVSFSKSFLDANVGSSAESAITEQIALIMEQFDYDETKVLIEGEEQSSLFGHMDATEPITANNPDDYETIE